jgi:hypothetical protein
LLWFLKREVSQCKMWSADSLGPAAACPQNLYAWCNSTLYSSSVMLVHAYLTVRKVSLRFFTVLNQRSCTHHRLFTASRWAWRLTQPLYSSRSSHDTVWRREIACQFKIFPSANQAGKMLQRDAVRKIKLDAVCCDVWQISQLIPFHILKKNVAMWGAILKIKGVLAYLNLDLIYNLKW